MLNKIGPVSQSVLSFWIYHARGMRCAQYTHKVICCVKSNGPLLFDSLMDCDGGECFVFENCRVVKNKMCQKFSTNYCSVVCFLCFSYNGIKDMAVLQLSRLPSLKALFLQGIALFLHGIAVFARFLHGIAVFARYCFVFAWYCCFWILFTVVAVFIVCCSMASQAFKICIVRP